MASAPTGEAVGEVCFNTAMTGYQEILTDPSYAGQIITFTFPHIGNVGVNDEDIETVNMAAASGVRGCVLKTDITEPVQLPRDAALRPVAEGARHHRHRRRRHAGADRADPRQGMPNAVIVHDRGGDFDSRPPRRGAKAWPGLVGMDLAKDVTTGQSYGWDETSWVWGKGYGRLETPTHHVVAVDYGIKRNILRLLADHGCRVTVVPATATRRRDSRPQAGRRLPLQRPRRSGRDRRVCRARDPRRHRLRARQPSASASATRCSASPSAARP